MLKNLIISKLTKSFSGHKFIIIHQLDMIVFEKWLIKFEARLKSLIQLDVKIDPSKTINLQSGHMSVTLLAYSDHMGQIKSPSVLIDSSLPNPYNYKVF